MEFINECNCIVDYEVLENAIREECKEVAKKYKKPMTEEMK